MSTHSYAFLRDRLGPYLTPGLELPEAEHFRFHDAPPAVVRDVLAQLDPMWSSYRPNGQPLASWLIDTAERLRGTVAGSTGYPGGLRVDAVCVRGDRGAELARLIDDAWPGVVLGGAALDLALAEGWTSWDADEPVWTAGGRELLDGRPRPPVVGLWWD